MFQAVRLAFSWPKFSSGSIHFQSCVTTWCLKPMFSNWWYAGQPPLTIVTSCDGTTWSNMIFSRVSLSRESTISICIWCSSGLLIPKTQNRLKFFRRWYFLFLPKIDSSICNSLLTSPLLNLTGLFIKCFMHTSRQKLYQSLIIFLLGEGGTCK